MSAPHKWCLGTFQLVARRNLRRATWLVLVGCLHLTRIAMAQAESPGPVNSPPQVILWGVQRGCDVDVAAERMLISRLELFAGRPVVRVNPPADNKTLNCVGVQCAQLLRNACPRLTGQLIGAEIDEVTTFDSRTPELVVRIRVWRQDLDSKENYYLYGLCPNGVCGNLSVPEKLAEMASHLTERQPFEEDMRSIEEVLASRLPLCAMQPPGTLERQLIASQTDICRPFPAPRCPRAEVAQVTSSAPLQGTVAPAGLSHRLIRGTQGALWGMFAVSTAAAVTLFALNSSIVGSVVVRPQGTIYEVHGLFLGPAVTAASFSLAALVVALPTTIFLGRAAKAATLPAQPAEIKLPVGGLRCPQ